MKINVFVSNHKSTFDSDGTRRYTTSPREAAYQDQRDAGMNMTIPAILDTVRDTSGQPYTDASGGWASIEAIMTMDEMEAIRSAGFEPIEREIIEVDGNIEPSLMVRCTEGRVRLDPNEMIVGALVEDPDNRNKI
jgi:hypothetical protein